MKTLDLQTLQLKELCPTEKAAISGGMDSALAYQAGHTAVQIIAGTCGVLGNWAMTALKWD